MRKRRALAGEFVGARAVFEAGHLRIPAAAVQDLHRRGPRARGVERGGERHVDAVLPELFVLRAVQQHHILFEVRVPVDGRAPEDIRRGLAIVERPRRRLQRRAHGILPARRFVIRRHVLHRQPRVVVPDRQAAGRAVAIGPRHTRHGHTLRGGVASVLAEVEVEELLVAIEGCAHVAHAAEDEAVGRFAGRGTGRRIEHDAEVVPRAAEVGRAGGADARQLPLGPAAVVGGPLMMIEAVPLVVVVGDERLEPHAVSRVGRERDAAFDAEPLERAAA